MKFNECKPVDVEALSRICGKEHVFVGAEIHEDYTHDEMTLYGKQTPEIVIEAQNEKMISEVLAYANEHNIPLTTRGAGTGLCGGCVPIQSGIVLSTLAMNKILEIDTETMSAVVEPGVLLMELAEEVGKYDLLYAPDPGEKSATIGGNVSTNAGGMRAVKYGVTRDYVKGMNVVLTTGEVLELGGKIAKNSSGYSLKDLMIGSEGTLGIISKIVLKLLPKPKKMTSLLVPFDDLNSCLKMVPMIMRLPSVATTIEFMEKEVIEDASEYLGKQFPNKEFNAYLIISYSANSKAEMDLMVNESAELCLQNGAIDAFISDTEERQESIWNARGAFLEAIKNSTTQMDECDVVVNIDCVAEFLAFVKKLSVEQQVRIRSFGHAGDGNLHVYVCRDEIAEEKWNQIVHTCMNAMYQKAIELKGQVSGEHGIGHAKKGYLKQSLKPTQIEMMKGIKKVFDPKGILNPGKVIDLE